MIVRDRSRKTRALWNLWFRAAHERLSHEPGDPGSFLSGSKHRYARQLLWLYERLRQGEPLRINAGGKEYESEKGGLWGKDAFYFSGHRHQGWSHLTKHVFLGKIRETEDKYLYQTEREFASWAFRPGYRIPLPRGEYRIRLHFAELKFHASGVRRFGVRVENELVAELDLFDRVGFARPYTVEHRTTLEDGLLEIEFVARKSRPQISGIEIIALR